MHHTLPRDDKENISLIITNTYNDSKIIMYLSMLARE